MKLVKMKKYAYDLYSKCALYDVDSRSKGVAFGLGSNCV